MDVLTAEINRERDKLADSIDDMLRNGLTLEEAEEIWLGSIDRQMTDLAATDPKLTAQLRPVYAGLVDSAIRQRRLRR